MWERGKSAARGIFIKDNPKFVCLNKYQRRSLMSAPLNDQSIDKIQKDGGIFTLTLQKYLYYQSTHTFWFLSSSETCFGPSQ